MVCQIAKLLTNSQLATQY